MRNWLAIGLKTAGHSILGLFLQSLLFAKKKRRIKIGGKRWHFIRKTAEKKKLFARLFGINSFSFHYNNTEGPTACIIAAPCTHKSRLYVQRAGNNGTKERFLIWGHSSCVHQRMMTILVNRRQSYERDLRKCVRAHHTHHVYADAIDVISVSGILLWRQRISG